MKAAPENTFSLMMRVIRNPHLWIIAVMLVFLIIVHYHELFTGKEVLYSIGSVLGFGLTRNTIARILFLIPVIYGTAKLGMGAGISLLVLVTAAMFPRVFLISLASYEALVETIAVIIVGIVAISFLYVWQQSRLRLGELEITQRELNSHIQRLSMLHVISNLINQSLDLKEVMDSVIAKIAQLMNCPLVWIYLKNRDRDELTLFASYGFSQTIGVGIPGLGLKPVGLAARSLKPVIIEDSSLYRDRVIGAEVDNHQLPPTGIDATHLHPGSISAALTQEGIKSLMVVPLISKNRAIGTLGIGFHNTHKYPSDEVDLLTAVADQLSMEVVNAYLYQKERQAVEELRVSEKNFRDIFENASDAIWIHDTEGKILAANSALCRLTGYEPQALTGANVSLLFPAYNSNKTNIEAHERALKGGSDHPFEEKLIKKDGSEVILQIGTSLISRGGKSQAFQHVARDITEERKIQENLKLYAQKVSQAQEAERKRIARELHDETVQALVVVSRHLYNLASGKSKLTALDIQGEVQKISEGVRHYSQELRPLVLDDLGLLPALEWLVSNLTKNYGIDVKIEVGGTRRPLEQESELILFRITQEALTNVRKHSQATKALVKVDFTEQKVRVSIRDNGKGFEIPSTVGDLARMGKLGLAGMEERAQLLGGTLNIESKPEEGTTLTVEIPC